MQQDAVVTAGGDTAMSAQVFREQGRELGIGAFEFGDAP
jgi:hypothetical protein